MSSNPLANKSQAWSALFTEPMSELVQRYTASVGFDQRLWRADIQGSLAHAQMLAAQRIIAPQDLADIERGLALVASEIESGAFEWKLALEDVHLNIEARLTELVGDAGKRLHTGRSRNDQVATDVRLWLRGEIDQLSPLLHGMQRALVALAAQHTDTVMPGYTHMQVAQPVSFAHHLLAYVEMFARDADRLLDVRKRVNQLPLGAAALAGTSYPLDRERVAKTLGFDGVCQNSLDAVSDRDFALEFAAFAAITMVHVSRLAEEIVLWMSQNFGFIDLADRYCTGSSIMPQKRNPDVAELARGKSGRLVGNLTGLLTTLKGLPLAYNRDLQEDKEPVFDSVETLEVLLPAFTGMVATLTFNTDRMAELAPQGFSLATDVADWLVRQGVPFREAHEHSGALVALCEERGIDLHEATDAELAGISPQLTPAVRDVLTVEGSIASRSGVGGTAPERVSEQLAQLTARIRALM